MVLLKKPVLQVALDFIDLKRALKAAAEAVSGGADWIEAGTPLVKSEGLNAVRQLKKLYPDKMIIADMKVMDAGRIEVESAAKAGADIVCVLAAATDETIKECIEAGKNYGASIEVDLIGIKNTLKRAKEIEKMGADIIGVHCAIDEQMHGKEQFGQLGEICSVVNIPVAIAGGIHSENAALAVKTGASIVIAGGSITKSKNAKRAASDLKKAIDKKIRIRSDYYKRVSGREIKDVFSRLSVSNVSDAMHRGEVISGIKSITKGSKISGRVITVRTYPGDWAKPVIAVDTAEPGDIIFIDAGGVGPAVWGELATHGAIQKKIGGIIINGAARDIFEIRKTKLPVFAKITTGQAGEPKGFGEIGVPLKISGISICQGDWVIADDDGICVIPSKNITETANRAMNVLEAENRLREEIDNGGTLGKIAELLKWEKCS